MKAEFWHQKWQRNEIGFDQPKVNPLLKKHFNALQLAPNSPVFVPLCGKSIDMVWLLQQGMQVVGVELSQDAIERFFEALDTEPEISQLDHFTCYQAENMTIYVGDFFALDARHLGQISASYDRAALVALPEVMRKDYAHHLSLITDNAPQLLITFDYDQSQHAGPPFAISADEVRSHYAHSYQIQLLESVPVIGGLKGHCEALEQLWLLKK
ncbi:MAG: thiopurine S-methyltransferase [Marinicella sp.]